MSPESLDCSSLQHGPLRDLECQCRCSSLRHRQDPNLGMPSSTIPAATPDQDWQLITARMIQGSTATWVNDDAPCFDLNSMVVVAACFGGRRIRSIIVSVVDLPTRVGPTLVRTVSGAG